MPESVEGTNHSSLLDADSITSDCFKEIYRTALAPSSPLACYLEYSVDFLDANSNSTGLGSIHQQINRHVAVSVNEAPVIAIDLRASGSYTRHSHNFDPVLEHVKDVAHSQLTSGNDREVEITHPHDDARYGRGLLPNFRSCRHPLEESSAIPITTSIRRQSVSGSPLRHGTRLPRFKVRVDRRSAMDDVECHPRHSNGSTLSTTQENDPSVYEQYQRYDEDDESEEGDPDDHPTHDIGHVPRSQTSLSRVEHGVSDSRTELSYAPGETGFVEFGFDTPFQDPNAKRLARSEHASTSPVENDGRGSNPKTPGLPKPFFARPNNLLGGSQLFDMTQVTPGNGLPSGPLIPSSSRPSPNMYTVGLGADNPVSSPLISRARSHMGEHTTKAICSSLIDQPQEVLEESHKYVIDADNSHPRNFGRMSSISSRTAMPTRATYVSRKASQEARQRGRYQDAPRELVSSDEEEFSDSELRQRFLVKKRRELGSRTLANAQSFRPPTSSAASLIEVPSTANRRRRSDADDDNLESGRPTQDDSAIADSQGQTGREEMNGNPLDHRVRASFRSPSSDSMVDAAAELEMKDGNDEHGDEGMPALDPGLGSLSTSGERAPSPPSSNKHSRVEKSSSGAVPGALGTQKESSSKDVDITILETSPPLAYRSTFLGVPIDSSAADLLDAEFIEPSQPQYDADLEDAVFGSSSPIRPTVARRRFGRRVKGQLPPSSTTSLNAKEPQSPGGQDKSQQDPARPIDASAKHAASDEEPSWRNGDCATAHEAEDGGTALSPQSSDLSTVHLSDFDEIEMSFAQKMGSGQHGEPKDSSQSSGSTPDEDLIVASKEPPGLIQAPHLEPAQPTTKTVTNPSCSLRLVPMSATAAENVSQITSALNETAPVNQAISNTEAPVEIPVERARVSSKANVPSSQLEVISARPEPFLKPAPGSVTRRSSKRLSAAAPPVSRDSKTSKETKIELSSSPLATQLSNRAVRALAKSDSREFIGQHTAQTSTSFLASGSNPASVSGGRSRQRYSESEDELAYNGARQDMASVAGQLGRGLQTSGSAQSAAVTSESRIFHNMAFAVSYSKNDSHKPTLVRDIKENGGLLLEDGFEELFTSSSSAPNTPKSKAQPIIDLSRESLTLTTQAKRLGFVCLIADHHSRKAKFMQALALDLPCLSGLWVLHCVHAGAILDWGPYLLAAGESVFLGGAIRSRSLHIYQAVGHQFSDIFKTRAKMLDGKAIILVMGKGKAEERKRAYYFLTQALGAQRVKRVLNSDEARKCLSEAAVSGENWDWVYVDEDPVKAEQSIFGEGVSSTQNRKRKKPIGGVDELVKRPAKKARIVSDEYVIQSLILGRLLDEQGGTLLGTT